jgi:hypothetical protein
MRRLGYVEIVEKGTVRVSQALEEDRRDESHR